MSKGAGEEVGLASQCEGEHGDGADCVIKRRKGFGQGGDDILIAGADVQIEARAKRHDPFEDGRLVQLKVARVVFWSCAGIAEVPLYLRNVRDLEHDVGAPGISKDGWVGSSRCQPDIWSVFEFGEDDDIRVVLVLWSVRSQADLVVRRTFRNDAVLWQPGEAVCCQNYIVSSGSSAQGLLLTIRLIRE